MQPVPATPSVASVTIEGIAFEYDDRVLRPRPWTALQSLWAAEILESCPPGPVLELCAGAGHIGLVAVAANERHLVAVDLDSTACAYTRSNAERAGLGHRVTVRHGRLTSAVSPDERFTMVLADPPWVPTQEVGGYPDDPTLAIDGGVEGLNVAFDCVEVARRCLDPGASLLLQLGTAEQADAVLAGALASGGWVDGGRRVGERGLVLRLQRV